jgi:hypothetical protein
VAGFKPELGFISDNAKFGCAVVHYAFRRSFQIVGLYFPTGPLRLFEAGTKVRLLSLRYSDEWQRCQLGISHARKTWERAICCTILSRSRSDGGSPRVSGFSTYWKPSAGAPGSDPGAPSMAKLSAQNIPFELTRGRFGASQGAEFFGLPTGCKVSQCSTALPSVSIL